MRIYSYADESLSVELIILQVVVFYRRSGDYCAKFCLRFIKEK
jgi:hypothetical protein